MHRGSLRGIVKGPRSEVPRTGRSAREQSGPAGRAVYALGACPSSADLSMNEWTPQRDESLLPGEPTRHAQSYRFAGLGGLRERLHAVSPYKNSSTAAVEEYPKVCDPMDHAFDRNEVVGVVASQDPCSLRCPSYPSPRGDGN